MPQDELEVAKPLLSWKTTGVIMALCGLLITIGFLQKSGRVTAATGKVAAWREERRARSEAEEAERIALENREAAWRKKCEQLRSIPVDTRPSLAFRGSQRTMSDVPLRTDQWSRLIEIPAGKYVEWSVHPTRDFYVVFGDGFMDEVIPQGPAKDYTGHPGPFRLLGKSPGQSASLELHVPLATLNNSPR